MWFPIRRMELAVRPDEVQRASLRALQDAIAQRDAASASTIASKDFFTAEARRSDAGHPAQRISTDHHFERR